MSMHDAYGRSVRSLRLSVTTRCNQKCFYCHCEGQEPCADEMTAGDMQRLFSVARLAGITKLKITGGEPLLREDIVDVVSLAGRSFDEVSMTTNGVLLASLATDLKRAGLRRINVSLDTLHRPTYREITGSDDVDQVLEGIDEAIRVGLMPLKINTVLLSGLNSSHVEELLSYAASKGAILQLIELNPVDGKQGHGLEKYFYPLGDMEESFAARAISVERNELHDRKRYTLPFNGGTVKVEFVRPVGRGSFCMNCTRIRVTSDGMLKPCLMTRAGMTDILSSIRTGSSDDDLLMLLENLIKSRRPYWVAK